MKHSLRHLLLLLGFMLTLSSSTFAQQASAYFPTGSLKWAYRIYTLDSNNAIVNPPQFQVDSVGTGTVTFEGRTARRIFTNIRSALRDTSHVSLENTNAFIFFEGLTLGIGVPGGFGFSGLQRWYSAYRFAQTVNTNYTLLDTVITIPLDTTNIPLRLQVSGRRLADQNITVPVRAQAFAAKKFVVTTSVGVQLLPPPFPPLPLFAVPDTAWIADSTWIVKRHQPSTRVDLSQFGAGTITLPGTLTELVPESFLSVRTDTRIPKQFALEQNYPNPFNPSTEIRYQVSGVSDVRLEVFDMLGRKVATLVSERQAAGSYQVNFNAVSFASGVYFYRLQAGAFVETRKMMLVR
jgi:hypothetical protein